PPTHDNSTLPLHDALPIFTGSVEEAIATAKEIASDKFVTVASADIIQQALNLALVDELCISQVPVLFGTGIRYFGELVGGHIMLDRKSTRLNSSHSQISYA